MTDVPAAVAHFSDEKADLAREELAALFGRHDRVLLAFSGGKESLALARLCEPYEGRFKLLWANTGFMFPHVEALIRTYGERFGLHELQSDLVENWKLYGLPSALVPIDNAMPGGMHREPRMQANVACCAILRSTPLLSTLQGITEPAAVIHGQRREDRVQAMGMSGWPLPEHVEVSAPLADWSTEEVLRFLAAENVALPEHYADITDSLDCWACTAAFGEDKGPARAAYMRKAYPQFLDVVLPSVRRMRDAVRSPLERLDLAIDRTSPGQDEDPTFVLQWAPQADDCVVAALGTVIGRSYAETAALLGVALEPATRQPLGLKGKGIVMAHLGGPLLSIGLTATMILSTAGGGLLDAPSMRRHLEGRRAVVAVATLPPGVEEYQGRFEQHALAWTGTRLFDCRGPEARELDIDNVAILGAVIVTELHAA